MGRQIQLYLTPGDLARFEESLRAKLEFVCLNCRSDGPHPSFLPSFEIQEMGKTWLTLFLCRSEDVGTLRFREVPAQGYWTIDVPSEPILELSRPYFDGVLMRRGRLYYQKGDFIADGSWRAKPEAFLKWADTAFRVARTTLQRDVSLDGYLGSEAHAMRLGKEVRFARV
jgi:hypothetical protein